LYLGGYPWTVLIVVVLFTPALNCSVAYGEELPCLVAGRQFGEVVSGECTVYLHCNTTATIGEGRPATPNRKQPGMI
jgi:hypothetical protein